ncbi:peroxynitrite isomerase [Mycobacterium sp. pV006]|uniref:peroxynitrite isomerase n=1 Tax=Mycobacterium sp. pV006 TaxID=3238983 RepID=UPI00351BE445
MGSSPPQQHPDLVPLAPLIGTWSGAGSGEYPTIRPFDYLEEVTFGHVGKPFLAYAQRTRAADDGRPLHAETGYLRVTAADRVEWILAHPTGITEILEGQLDADGDRLHMELRSTVIGRSTTAKDVASMERSITLDGDTLDYTVRMAAVDLPLQHHLAAVLRRSA